MDNGKVPDLPPAADESNVDSNEIPAQISNADERTVELPEVDNETEVDTDLSGSPTHFANAAETPEVPAHNNQLERYGLLLIEALQQVRRLRQRLERSIAAERSLLRTQQDLQGNPIPLTSEETPNEVVYNGVVMTYEELVKRLLPLCGRLQEIEIAEATQVATEIRLQPAESYAASSDIQTQTGLNQSPSDCSETNESKSLSNVTSEPSIRNMTIDSLQCREDEQPINDISDTDGKRQTDASKSSSNVTPGPSERNCTVDSREGKQPINNIRQELEAATQRLLNGLRSQSTFHEEMVLQELSKLEQGMLDVYTKAIEIKSTSIQTQLIDYLARSHGSGDVQLMSESSVTSSRHQGNGANVRNSKKKSKVPCSSSTTSRTPENEGAVLRNASATKAGVGGIDELSTQSSQNEEQMREMTERALHNVPSTSTKTESDVSVASTSGDVQLMSESSATSSHHQGNNANVRYSNKTSQAPCSSSITSRIPENESAVLRNASATKNRVGGVDEFSSQPSQNEQMREMTEHTVPSTSTETRSDAPVASTHTSNNVQSVPEFSKRKSQGQRRREKARLQKQENP